jgi:NAD(P)-dependent dehydrogenase (short-subunit alcohol dehydrogenase family)
MKGALVTGGGRRIGAEIARSLGQEGWHVFVHYNRSADEARQVAAQIVAAGGSASAIQADLTEEADIRRLFAACDAHCPLGAVVNNASRFTYDQVGTASFAAMDSHMRSNLYAPAILSQLLAQSVEARQGEACIINMIDNKVFALNPDYFSYTLSKVALQGMTQMLALALAPRIRVCGIAPGITLVSGEQSVENFQRAHRNNPARQGCTVEQIAAAVTFILATPSYNGQTLVIDGGQALQRLDRDVAFLPE